MIAGLTMLLAKIAAFAVWIGQIFVKCFVAFWDLLRDAACWPFEEVMKIIKATLNALPLEPLTNTLSGMGSMPSEVLNLLALMGVGGALTMIAAAIGIRLLLQLIPFTRLGS